MLRTPSEPADRTQPVEAAPAALALSVTTTIGLAAFLRQATANHESTTTAAISASTTGDTTASVATGDTTTATADSTVAASTEAAAASTAIASGGSTGMADGTYTGDSVTNRWGDVQVEITVADGAITDVTVLQYPDGENKSVQINQRALPSLIESTLTAQSADVDTVSGATYTSESYRESLQTAIDDARAAAAA